MFIESRMKILLIVPEFPPHHTWWGGVVFESLAKTYTKLWNEVLVISWDYTENNIFKKLKQKKEKSVDIIRIPELYTPISLLNTVMPIPFWYNKKLKKIVKEFNPKFVHIHGYGLFMPAQLSKICRKLKILYTFTIHWAPVSPEKMKNPIISFAYNFYHRFYGFPMLDWANRLTAVSSYARDFEIFKNYKDKIEIIWNGINSEEYKKPDFDIFSEKKIRKDENTKIILSLWRIEWWKGFQKIIELLPEMEDKWYKVKYCIWGRDNWYRSKLYTLSKKLGVDDNIVYLDFLSWDNKLSALYNCDVFAVPSIEWETFGISALEWRFVWKPIITSFIWWLKDALDWYDNAYKIEDWEKAFFKKSISDEKINNFFYEEIAKNYIY